MEVQRGIEDGGGMLQVDWSGGRKLGGKEWRSSSRGTRLTANGHCIITV